MADEVDLYGDLYNDAEAAVEEDVKPSIDSAAQAAFSGEDEKPFVQQPFYGGNGGESSGASGMGGGASGYGNNAGGYGGGAQQNQNQNNGGGGQFGGGYEAGDGGGDNQNTRPSDMPEEGLVCSLDQSLDSLFPFFRHLWNRWSSGGILGWTVSGRDTRRRLGDVNNLDSNLCRWYFCTLSYSLLMNNPLFSPHLRLATPLTFYLIAHRTLMQ